MTPEQAAAFVTSQAAAAVVEASAMQAENSKWTVLGQGPAYGYDQFKGLIEKYGLGCNTVLQLFQDVNQR